MLVRIIANKEPKATDPFIARQTTTGKLCIIDNCPDDLVIGHRWIADIILQTKGYNIVRLLTQATYS